MWSDLAIAAFEACTLPIAVIVVFDATRQVATGGFKKAPTTSLGGGILMFLVLAGLALFQYYIATLKIEILQPKSTPTFDTAPTHNLSPEQRIEFDHLRAKSAYWGLGELRSFRDKSGMSVTYTPSSCSVRGRSFGKSASSHRFHTANLGPSE